MIKKLFDKRYFILFIFPFLIGSLTVLSFQPFNLTIINFLIIPLFFYFIVFISKKSPDLIGEDEIFSIGNYGIKPKFATIRFHLHHEINPIKLQNQNLLLQNSTNKIIGKFFSSSDNIEIDNTIIYQNSERYVSKQIVNLVELKKIRELNKLIIKWSLKFEK